MASYLKNKDLHKELVYCQAKGEFSRTLYKMCLQIINGLSWKYTYYDESVREDCKAFAMERCYINYKNYDTDRGDAFTYMTQIVKSSFYFEFNRQEGIKRPMVDGKQTAVKINTIPFSRIFTDGEIRI
jgi:hypothetical protein